MKAMSRKIIEDQMDQLIFGLGKNSGNRFEYFVKVADTTTKAG